MSLQHATTIFNFYILLPGLALATGLRPLLERMVDFLPIALVFFRVAFDLTLNEALTLTYKGAHIISLHHHSFIFQIIVLHRRSHQEEN